MDIWNDDLEFFLGAIRFLFFFFLKKKKKKKKLFGIILRRFKEKSNIIGDIFSFE